MSTDLRTAVKRLVRKLRLDSTTSGNVAEQDAKIAIIEAMNFNKHTAFWFNRSKFKIGTKSESFRYKLPSDYVSIIGKPLFNSSSNESATRRHLDYRPLDWCEEQKWRGTETEMTINTGSPEVYSIDESTNEMLLIPVPYVDGESVELDYLSDCEIPEYKHDGSSYVFYYKGTTDTLSDSFTNAWLENAFELIVSYAGYKLLSFEYGGEGDVEAANRYQSQWAMELMKLRGENSKRASVRSIARHI